MKATTGTGTGTGGMNPLGLVLLGSLVGAVGTTAYQRYAERRQRETPWTEQADQSRANGSGSGSGGRRGVEWSDLFESPADIPEWLLSATTSSRPLSVDVLQHLTRVYAALGATVLAATAGTAVQIRTNASPSVASLVSLGLAFSLAARARMWKLLGMGFFQGMVLGPLVGLGLRLDARIVPAALASSAAILGSFAAAATMSTRRSMLFLYGGLGSALSVLTLSGLANLFFKSRVLFNAQVYGGLAMFVGYVLADSQLIIERAALGSRDYASDAFMLFTDAVGIFSRVLYMLVERQAEQQRGSRRRQRRQHDEDEDEDAAFIRGR